MAARAHITICVLALACGVATTAVGQVGTAAPRLPLGDTAATAPLLDRNLFQKPVIAATGLDPKPSGALNCPMPIVAPDSTWRDRMPVYHPDTTKVQSMPVSTPTCNNALRKTVRPR